jgi:formylglycine-generating enzyme required for sulfatase activity
MTVLPAGRFEQGGDAAAPPFERPQHRVVMNRAFAMSITEVTVGEFREFVAATHRDMSGCNVYDGHWQYRQTASWQAPGFSQQSTHPVTCVSWDDAVAYAAWLSAGAGRHYRLPSASEWEYAARGGAGPLQPWRDDAAAACAAANVADQSAAQRFPGWTAFPCNDHYVNTAPVASFKANAFGINDLLGNVFEWVQDCWHDDYVGAPGDGSARLDGPCGERELRGGSWFTAPRYVTAAYRGRFASGYRSSAVGFRLVRDLGG